MLGAGGAAGGPEELYSTPGLGCRAGGQTEGVQRSSEFPDKVEGSTASASEQPVSPHLTVMELGTQHQYF